MVWAKQTFSTIGSQPEALLKDKEGKFYLSGYFNGDASFGSFNVSSANQDMFVARYDEDGNCLGVNHFGEATGFWVSSMKNGDIIASGNFQNTVNIGNTTLTSYGYDDIFIARMSAITGVQEEKKNVNNQLLIYANPNTGR